MTRRNAVLLMLLVTLMWSVAGVVTKRLDAAASFEVTFWRSAFNAVALLLILVTMRGLRTLVRDLFGGGWPLAVSSLCWSVMFTAFMMALTLTTVANVLITMALGPLFTALLAAVVLRHSLPLRTWIAIVVAGAGVAWMVGEPAQAASPQHWLGLTVALGVPLAAAVNWTLLQHLSLKARLDEGAEVKDLMPAVVWGALISAAVTLPLAWPLVASAHDVAWLAGLGAFQLAVPCLIAVRLTRVLSAPEVSLLALCEVLFGVTWAWLGAGESPTLGVLGGGVLVVTALAVNEWLGLRATHRRLQRDLAGD